MSLAPSHGADVTLAVSLTWKRAPESRVLMNTEPGSELASLCSKGTALSSAQLCLVNTYGAICSARLCAQMPCNPPTDGKTEARQGVRPGAWVERQEWREPTVPGPSPPPASSDDARLAGAA